VSVSLPGGKIGPCDLAPRVLRCLVDQRNRDDGLFVGLLRNLEVPQQAATPGRRLRISLTELTAREGSFDRFDQLRHAKGLSEQLQAVVLGERHHVVTTGDPHDR
jgi:hypothetical protein